MDEEFRLDGNAAAGPLARFFAFDITQMLVICNSCGSESPLGALHLYGGTMGIVLCCSKCSAVNLRALEVGDTLTLDTRGAMRMSLQLPAQTHR
jgi:Family of unknown function (DUF6510)